MGARLNAWHAGPGNESHLWKGLPPWPPWLEAAGCRFRDSRAVGMGDAQNFLSRLLGTSFWERIFTSERKGKEKSPSQYSRSRAYGGQILPSSGRNEQSFSLFCFRRRTVNSRVPRISKWGLVLWKLTCCR